jgi:hypothetical protein
LYDTVLWEHLPVKQIVFVQEMLKLKKKHKSRTVHSLTLDITAARPYYNLELQCNAVTNPDNRTGYLADGFEATRPDPAATSMTPDSGQEPDTVRATNPAGTRFMAGA